MCIAHHVELRFRDIDSAEHTRRVPGMYAASSMCCMMPADNDVFTVGQRIDINFDRVFQELVDQDRDDRASIRRPASCTA